jgi:salicylate hydroxylase
MPYIQESSAKQMKVCIIGAGMAGLTSALALAKAGFSDIEVYEYASDLGFVGAGIQMAPNMARILDRLGVWGPIARKAVVLNETSIRAGDTDTELASLSLRYIEKTYGYPHMVGHRATLARELYNGCLQHETIKFFFGTDVQNVKLGEKPSFTARLRKSEESKRVECELLLACDGVKSRIRDSLLKAIGASVLVGVEDTGQAAYRIMLTREQLQHDAELLALLDADQVVRWIGEKRHIIAYPVEDKSIYNLSTTQPDANFAAAPSATYTTKGSKTAMLDVFSDYCPMIQRMLDLVPEGEVCEWKLRVHAPLPTWVHRSVALVGDACHPTLPHLAQGAAQAIEDAAVLGTVLGRVPDSTPSTIAQALQVYEAVRKERAETLVAMAAASGRAMHLGEGKEKAERDAQFAAIRANGGKGAVPDKWADADVQRMIYGFDCQRVAETMADQAFRWPAM